MKNKDKKTKDESIEKIIDNATLLNSIGSANEISLEEPSIDENQLKLDLLKGPDERAERQFENKKLDDSNLRFELISNRVTTIKEEWARRLTFTSGEPIVREPKFREFFKALGDLDNWTEEERKRYPKPPIAPKIINKLYERFPPSVKRHFQEKNPYFKWFIREYKNYYFLDKDGMVIMEEFIGDAILLMEECKSQGKSTKEFLFLHAEKFGTGFQLELFEKYLKSI